MSAASADWKNCVTSHFVKPGAHCNNSLSHFATPDSLCNSSVKWSDPGHFLESQGKFFLSFLCALFLHIFDI